MVKKKTTKGKKTTTTPTTPPEGVEEGGVGEVPADGVSGQRSQAGECQPSIRIPTTIEQDPSQRGRVASFTPEGEESVPPDQGTVEVALKLRFRHPTQPWIRSHPVAFSKVEDPGFWKRQLGHSRDNYLLGDPEILVAEVLVGEVSYPIVAPAPKAAPKVPEPSRPVVREAPQEWRGPKDVESLQPIVMRAEQEYAAAKAAGGGPAVLKDYRDKFHQARAALLQARKDELMGRSDQ